MADSEIDPGTWSVEKGALCTRWSKWDGGRKTCYRISASGEGYVADDADGTLKGPFELLR